MTQPVHLPWNLTSERLPERNQRCLIHVNGVFHIATFLPYSDDQLKVMVFQASPYVFHKSQVKYWVGVDQIEQPFL